MFHVLVLVGLIYSQKNEWLVIIYTADYSYPRARIKQRAIRQSVYSQRDGLHNSMFSVFFCNIYIIVKDSKNITNTIVIFNIYKMSSQAKLQYHKCCKYSKALSNIDKNKS